MSNNQQYRKVFIDSMIIIFIIAAGIIGYRAEKKIATTFSESSKQYALMKQAEPAIALPSEIVIPEVPVVTVPDFPEWDARHQHEKAQADPLGRDAIHPPLKGLDVEFTKLSVNAGSGLTITSPHQSQIIIPANAFVDAKGKLIHGEVDVQYREFYNYIDFFLSGIPMHYADGDSEQLESAGMIEITASQNGEPVFVNPANKINVLLASMKDSKDYSLYYFDKRKNKWMLKGKDNVMTSAEGAQGWSMTKVRLDSTERKFTYYANEDYKIRMVCTSNMEPVRTSFLGRKKAPEKFNFHFVNGPQSVPELKELGTVTWSYGGSDAAELFEKLFVLKRNTATRKMIPNVWKSLSIEQLDSNSNYVLTLVGDSGILKLNVFPVLRTAAAYRKFGSRFAGFAAKQSDRLKTENEAFDKFQKDTSDYYAQNGRYVTTSQSANSFVMRQFAVDGFGIWNCDKANPRPQGAAVLANFTDQNGNRVYPTAVYLADKRRNTVYTYYTEDLKKFCFDPSSQNIVWAVFPEDRMAMIGAKEFKAKYSNVGKRCEFSLNMAPSNIPDKKELASVLKFDM